LDQKRVAEQLDLAILADLTEGGSRLVTHKKMERNPKLRRLALQHWMRKMKGEVRCLACEFSFGDMYGRAGQGFIEMHHKRPLAELKSRTRQLPDDLIPLCSNCHRMVHRVAREPLTLSQLRGLLVSKA